MRILFVAPRFHTNQVPLVRALIEAGHDVHFDVLFAGPTEDWEDLQPTVLPASGVSRLLMRVRAPANAAKYHADHTFPSTLTYVQRLRMVKPDVVIIRDPSRPSSWRAALAARLLGVRVVLYTQGAVHAPPSRKRDLLRASVMRLLNAPWFSPVQGDVRFPNPHQRLHYLPFAADLSRAIKVDWFRGGALHMLSIGKFVPRKGHLLLLRAFDELRRHHDVRLTLVGELSTTEHATLHSEVTNLIEERGLADLVTVRTNVPFGDVSSLYLAHDVFILPSRNEQVGVSVLEAMSHGLPVVCSTTSGARWYVEPGGSGAVFESDDLSDLTAKLDRLCADRADLIRMGTRGRQLAETVHHPYRIRDELLAIIESRTRLRVRLPEVDSP